MRLMVHSALLHKVWFNYPLPMISSEVYLLAFGLHIYSICLYFAGVRRCTRKARKAVLEQLQQQQKQGQDGAKETGVNRPL